MYVKQFTSFCQALKRCKQQKIGSFFLPHGVVRFSQLVKCPSKLHANVQDKPNAQSPQPTFAGLEDVPAGILVARDLFAGKSIAEAESRQTGQRGGAGGRVEVGKRGVLCVRHRLTSTDCSTTTTPFNELTPAPHWRSHRPLSGSCYLFTVINSGMLYAEIFSLSLTPKRARLR